MPSQAHRRRGEPPWKRVVELVRRRELVPVIGDGVLTVERDGKARPFIDLLAEETAARLADEFDLAGLTIPEMVARFEPQEREELLEVQVHNAHEDLLARLRTGELRVGTPTRLLAEIDELPLLLTTSTHGLLEAALAAHRPTEVLVCRRGEEVRLPAGWERGTVARIVHLFGRISGALDFPLSEEDLLERLWDKKYVPTALLEALTERHLLFIGTGFPEWLGGMLMRFMRSAPLSRDPKSKALADDDVPEGSPLTLFLEGLGRHNWVYRGGDAAGFVEAFHARWAATRSRDADIPAAPPAQAADPESLVGVFVSYSDTNRSVAERIVQQLKDAGLEPWYDRHELHGGEATNEEIQRQIERCDLFMPLISRATEAELVDTYFRREWELAQKRAPSRFASGLPFIVPIIIDDLRYKDLHTIPSEFRSKHVGEASEGQLSNELLKKLVDDVQEIRKHKKNW